VKLEPGEKNPARFPGSQVGSTRLASISGKPESMKKPISGKPEIGAQLASFNFLK
jgi:hypothetical protein